MVFRVFMLIFCFGIFIWDVYDLSLTEMELNHKQSLAFAFEALAMIICIVTWLERII